MKIMKYIMALSLACLAMVMSCTDESLFPLPYNDKDVAAYLRMYKITSNLFDLNDITNNAGANTGFEVTYEIVDEEYGDNLQEVEFYVSHRRGTGLTGEMLVKKVDASVFANVPEPTYSEYKRATIRLTYAEVAAALAKLTTDPDGASPCATPLTPQCSVVGGLVAYPGSLSNADALIFRWLITLKDGRKFSVANPQNTVNAAFGNPLQANTTPNITGGQFYSSPFTFSVGVRTLAASSWVGTYNLTQSGIWSPAHGWDFHAFFPANLKSVLFPNQVVTLATVAGGLSSEREFSVSYKGINTKMRINLENGVVFVPLQYAGSDCSSERQIFWNTPTGGTFAKPGSSTVNLVAPLPTATITNRGAYSTAIAGTATGNVITIGLDDDADEYGRRNGYCTWTRRVVLTLTKI